jgi:hypothetical protein
MPRYHSRRIAESFRIRKTHLALSNFRFDVFRKKHRTQYTTKAYKETRMNSCRDLGENGSGAGTGEGHWEGLVSGIVQREREIRAYFQFQVVIHRQCLRRTC